MKKIKEIFEKVCYELMYNRHYPLKQLRHYYQRIKYGVSDMDCWSLDYYLSKVISKGCRTIKKHTCGYPCSLESMEQWEKILEEIAWTFDTKIKIGDMDWRMHVDKKHEKELQESYTNSGFDIHIMTKEEIKRYKNGKKLFMKYFDNLWD